MTFEFDFLGLWWPAIVVGTVLFTLLSMVWYTPRLFGAMWMEDEGLDMERAREIGTPMLYVATQVMALIANISVALILDNVGYGVLNGLVVGLILGVGIASTLIGPHYMFAGKSVRLMLIQMGHAVLLMTASGLVIGSWN